MGVLTDFVVAEPGDAQRVGDSDRPSREFNGIEAKGIDTVKLGTLYAILTKTPFDPALIGKRSFLYTRSDEGPWVVLVPPDLVQRLAKLSARQLVTTASKWSKTEEFSPKHDNWPAAAVEQVLKEIARLCRQADAEGKALLMWMSL